MLTGNFPGIEASNRATEVLAADVKVFGAPENSFELVVIFA